MHSILSYTVSQISLSMYLLGLSSQSINAQRTRTLISISLYSLQCLAQSGLFKITLLLIRDTLICTPWNTAFVQSIKSGKVPICQLERASIMYLIKEKKENYYLILVNPFEKYGGFCLVESNHKSINNIRKGGREKRNGCTDKPLRLQGSWEYF